MISTFALPLSLSHTHTRMYLQQEYFLYLAVQDPHAPPRQGFNEKKNVSVWTKLGRNKLTTANHLRLVESFRPNVFEPLCDTAPSAGNKLKRIKKSVDRTLSFLDETLAAREESKVSRPFYEELTTSGQ